MKKRGHDVYEIVCYNRHGIVEDEHVHVLYNGTVGKVLMRLQTANRANEDLTISYAINYIEQFVKKHKIDLIHLNNPHDSFLGIRDIGKLTEWCPVAVSYTHLIRRETGTAQNGWVMIFPMT